MIKMFFRKTALLALVAALTVLGVASLLFVCAAAQGANDPATQGQISNERLEQIWARQLRRYERMGRTNEFVERLQDLLNRATTHGKDVSAIQSALDKFENAVKDARPTYASMKSIVNSHPGFDADGKVTNPEKAKKTIEALHEKMREIKTAMQGTGQVLREAIQAFRRANPRLLKISAP